MTGDERTRVDGLPVVEPPAQGDADRRTDVAAVLLAAGAGERFEGGNKLLAALDGEPVVRHAARTLAEASVAFADAVAVVGHDAHQVAAALTDLPVRAVENRDHDAGQATSVLRGLSEVGDVDAVLFALGDMPRVDPESVEALVAAHRAGAGSALAAAHGGERGNPVLFDSRHLDALAALTGDQGGRDVLLGAADAALVETGDPGVLLDVDTRADLEALE